jgi:glycerate-2-kinase
MVKTKWSRKTDRKTGGMITIRKGIKKLFFEALKAFDPLLIVKNYLIEVSSYFLKRKFGRLIVIGFGKASCHMAKTVEDVFDIDLITGPTGSNVMAIQIVLIE